MGATPFEHYADGAAAADAFARAVADARDEYGNSGYTGSIAEKDRWVIVGDLMTPAEASAHANRLLHQHDPRIDDKWGPAGAIAIKQPTRTLDLPGRPATRHGGLTPDQLDQARRAAAGHGLLADGETVTAGHWQRLTGTGTGTAHLTITRNPATVAAQSTPDGWLFFGWANS